MVKIEFMIHLVTYSAPNCSASREVCAKAAYAHGANKVYEFTPEDIDSDFVSDNVQILNAERGVGYWLWKPYFINKIAKECNDGDILVYCDAGVKIINNLNHIIDVMDQDIFMFSNGHQHVHWCKADVMNAISKASFFTMVQDDPHYQALQQVQASVIFFKVNQNTRNFIKEWLLWCQMPGFIDDSPSKLPNHPEFAQHRYDQAILTCIQIKYGYKLHYWADARWYESQRYRWPGDDYPLMFDHHRFRNKGSGTGDVEWP